MSVQIICHHECDSLFQRTENLSTNPQYVLPCLSSAKMKLERVDMEDEWCYLVIAHVYLKRRKLFRGANLRVLLY
jgi:hypothetical protein